MTRQPRVLIVDDHEERRARLSRALAAPPLPFASAEAASGADGLSQLSSASWDALILTDRLPDADGLELIDRARAAGIDVPVLLLVAPGDPARAAEAIRRGATEIAFQSDDLERIIADAVARAILRHREKGAAEFARSPRPELEPILETAREAWHEVNNRLFVIEGSIQLLLAAAGSDDRAIRTHVVRIQRACEQIHTVMRQLREATTPVCAAVDGDGAPPELDDHVPSVSYEL